MQPATAEPIHVQQIAEEIMKGNLTSSQIGAFLTALKLLNLETNPLYIKAVATAMRNASIPVSGGRVVDIVGTGTRYTNLGGDGHDTFNVSTAASIVVAGAGVKVAKVYLAFISMGIEHHHPLVGLPIFWKHLDVT